MTRKKSSSKVIIAIVLLLIIGLGAIVGYKIMNKEEGVKVTTDKVTRKSITQTVSAIGKIQPETEVKISSEASGEIMFLGVKDGQDINANQLLVRIQPDIIATQVEQSESATEAAKVAIDAVKAERERAKSDLERITKLFQKEFASREELDRAKATFETAESRYQSTLSEYQRALSALKQIKAQASRTTIFSPISGTVTSLSVEQGEKVVGTAQMQGTEMMRIADLKVMNALVDVDENDIVFVKIGDTATINIDALPNETIKGTVVEIAHSAKMSNTGTQEEVTNFQVKIRIIDPDKRLRPGMSCNVEILTETHHNVLAVPLQAVTVRQDEEKPDEDKPEDMTDDKKKPTSEASKRPPTIVFINEKGTAKQRKVETGLSDQGFIEIKSGLKEGDVIVSGNFQAVNKLLKENDKLIIDNDTKLSKKKK